MIDNRIYWCQTLLALIHDKLGIDPHRISQLTKTVWFVPSYPLFRFFYLFFYQAMLVYEPSRRITARDALLHPYFADLDKTTVPATGEEYIGLPLDQLPHEVAAMFLADAGEAYRNPGDSENAGRSYQILPKTVELGSDALPTAKFLSTQQKSSISCAASQPTVTVPVVPLADSQEVNMSLSWTFLLTKVWLLLPSSTYACIDNMIVLIELFKSELSMLIGCDVWLINNWLYDGNLPKFLKFLTSNPLLNCTALILIIMIPRSSLD